eukprot:6209101-Pleurochrysis_carterae.AAC.1
MLSSLRNARGCQELCCLGVMVGQILFLLSGYLHALWRSELDWERIHISGVLDHEQRSFICGVISLFPSAALLVLELTRSSPYLLLRMSLALITAIGVLVTCAWRESECYAMHALGACLAFGSGVLLVWFLAKGHSEERRRSRILCASILTFLCFITGLAQGLYLLGLFWFPSSVLALGEAAMVLGFAAAIARSSDYGAATGSIRS